MIDISKLITSKTTEVEYPYFDGFKVTLVYLPREELQKIRKKATTQKFDKRTRTPTEEVDNELFQDLYVKAVVKGWTGLKNKYLVQLIPIDLEPSEEESEVEVPYTPANAVALMKNSTEFDNFVTDIINDLGNFTKNS